MSWFGSYNNGGQHNASNKPRSGELGHVHRPVIIDHNGVQHPIVGLDYESHNSQQYIARTEKVVTYRRLPGMAYEEYIPSITEEYGRGDLSDRKDDFSSKSYDKRARGPIKDSYSDNGFRFNSSPSKDHRHTSQDDDDEHHKVHNVHVNNTKGTRTNKMKDQEYYGDEKNQRNGFTQPLFRPNYLRDQQDYYEYENPKTNVYSPPKGSVLVPTDKDLKNMGNDYTTRAPTGPFGTPPRNETSYETSNFKPVANSPPRFNPEPKKDQRNHNQEIIDNTKARRPYGMGVPGARPGIYAGDRYSGGTINSIQAAERYNGVLLTDK